MCTNYGPTALRLIQLSIHPTLYFTPALTGFTSMVFDHAARGVYAVKIPPRSKAMTAGRQEAFEHFSQIQERKDPAAMMKNEEATEHYNQVRT